MLPTLRARLPPWLLSRYRIAPPLPASVSSSQCTQGMVQSAQCRQAGRGSTTRRREDRGPSLTAAAAVAVWLVGDLGGWMEVSRGGRAINKGVNASFFLVRGTRHDDKTERHTTSSSSKDAPPPSRPPARLPDGCWACRSRRPLVHTYMHTSPLTLPAGLLPAYNPYSFPPTGSSSSDCTCHL